MEKNDLAKLKELLLEKREELLKELGQFKDREVASKLKDSNTDDSAYSFHMADVGTDNMEREKAFFFATREGKYLAHIDQALERIADGTYGKCAECIDEKQNLCPTCPEIPVERLKAVPTTTRCVPCKERAEKK